MGRGSSDAGGGSGDSGTAIGMLGESGGLQNTGKYVIRKKFFVSEEQDLLKAPPPPDGFLPSNITYQKIGPKSYEQYVEYESRVEPGQSNLVEVMNGIAGRFELDVQDELAPIASHPGISKLVEKYKGKINEETGKVTFKPYYTEDGDANKKPNPMFGKLYFTKPSATFRHIQQLSYIPSDIWNNVGKKVEALPAGWPSPPAYEDPNGNSIKYFWIVLSPQIYRRGSAYEIVRTYKLSDPGVPEELYKTTAPSTK